MDRGFPMLLIA